MSNIDILREGLGLSTPVKSDRVLRAEQEAKTARSNAILNSGAIGGLFNFVSSLPKSIYETGKSLVSGSARFALSTGEAIARPITKAILGKDNTEGPTYQVPVLGPIESYQTEAAKKVQAGQTPTRATLSTIWQVPLDEPLGVGFKPAFFAAGMIADVFGKQAVKDTVEFIAKSKVPEEIAGALKKSEVWNGLRSVFGDSAEQEVKSMSHDLASLKTTTDVSDYLKNKMATAAEAKTQTLNTLRESMGLGPTEGTLAKPISTEAPLNPLIQEAHKYKTAEEFVKNTVAKDKHGVKITSPFGDTVPLNADGTITVYHRTTPEIAQKIEHEGLKGTHIQGDEGNVYLSINPSGGRNIGKEKTVVLKFEIDPRKTLTDEAFRDGSIDLVARADDLKGVMPKQETQSVLTKSQLTDIWEKAKETTIPKLSPDQILEQVAKSKDANEISKYLDTHTTVDKSQIPQMSKVLTGVENPNTVRKIIEGFDITRTPRKLLDLPPDLAQTEAHIAILEDSLDADRGRNLVKYVSKTTGQLPEVTGNETMKSLTGSGKVVKNSNFGVKGDQLITEHGFTDLEEAQKAVDSYKERRSQLETLKKDFSKEVKDYRESLKAEPSDLGKSDSSIPKISGVSQGEVRSLEELAAQKQSELVPGYAGESPSSVASLPELLSKKATDVKSKINIIDYLRTPDRVLEKIGFGPEMAQLRAGYESYVKELPENLAKISEWIKRVPKDSSQAIFKYLDGKAIDLTPEQLKVANEIKDWLKEWADRLNLPEDSRISNYITHIFDDEIIKKEFDEDLAKIITNKLPGEVYDPFLQERLGAKGYRQDVWQALEAYVKRATRKVNLDPALEAIKGKAGESLDMSKIEASQWKYLHHYVANVNMRPAEIDNLIDNTLKSVLGYRFGQRPITRALSFLRRITYRGMLGLNPASALRNLSQGANTYAVLGEKYTALGYLGLLKSNAMKELADEGIFKTGLVQDRVMSATKKAVEKADSVLFSFFEMAERINRGAAYFGAKSKALAQGKSLPEAIDYAKGIVRKTQFSFGSIDNPVAINNDILKTLFQFQNYTLKQTEFLTELVKDKNFAGLLRYSLAGLAFVFTVGKAFGMKPKELLPLFRFETPPSLKAPVEVAKAALDTPDKYGNKRSPSQKLKDIEKAIIGLIPAGSQAKKTIEGLQTLRQGGSFDASGKIQFTQDQSLLKKAQTILFGKYASSNAQDYFNKADNNKQSKNKIKPIYDQAQKLKAEGKVDEAKKLVDSLSEADYEVYKSYKSDIKRQRTTELKKKVLPIYLQAQKLKESGDAQAAQRLVDKLQDDEYEAYKLVKKSLEGKL